jgi:hypothetical protein
MSTESFEKDLFQNSIDLISGVTTQKSRKVNLTHNIVQNQKLVVLAISTFRR